jgi:hypothetical protein
MRVRPPDKGYAGDERRKTPRIRLLSHVFFWAGRVEGSGTLHDLSSGGARIEDASPTMKVGSAIKLTFALNDNDAPIDLRGEVVRSTSTGFAVKFTDVNDELKEWIEQVIAQAGR